MAKKKKPLVFISYRRKDSSIVSRWLNESLQAAFGPASVFVDSEAIRTGDRWPDRINDALKAATVLIVVLGPRWLRLTDDHGRRRLDKEDDWVRNEIQCALDKRLLIIPLLVSGAVLPVKEALPSCLLPLLDFQALELREDRWDSDRNVLIKALEDAGLQRSGSSPLPSISMDEQVRRQAMLYEKQFEACKTALSLIYRARNAARQLKESGGFYLPDNPVRMMKSYYNAIQELLFEERAILPRHLFQRVHQIKGRIEAFVGFVSFYQEECKAGRRDNNEVLDILMHMKTTYQSLEEGHEQLVAEIQSFIGVESYDE